MLQLRLPLAVAERPAESFIVGASNRAAWDAVHQWRNWPGGALVVTGPAQSGKSHLAACWARMAGAWPFDRLAGAEAAAAAFRGAHGKLFIDDLDRGFDDAALTLAIDLARSEGGALLLIGRGRPNAWPAGSPDLASRLASTPLARLEEPDLDFLEAMLRRFARQRFLELPAPVARYLAQHMERSFAAAQAVSVALEAEARRASEPISYETARRALAAVGAAAAAEEESA